MDIEIRIWLSIILIPADRRWLVLNWGSGKNFSDDLNIMAAPL